MATGEIASVVAREEYKRRRHWSRILSREVLPRIVLIAGCILFIMPFYWMVVSALKTNAELTSVPPTLLPGVWA